MEHHGAALLELTENRELVEKIKENYREANLDSRIRLALEFAEKLTENPSGVTDEDVEILRNAGWDDREILDICQITSYFNFVNRMADGLGIELEK